MTAIRKHFRYAVSDKANRRIRGECIGHRSELPPFPPIVPIEERYNLSAAFRNGCIERRSLPSIGFGDESHLRLKLVNDFPRAVRRAVVHHDNFAVNSGEILFERAEDGLLDELLVVIRVNQYADQRPCHSSPKPFKSVAKFVSPRAVPFSTQVVYASCRRVQGPHFSTAISSNDQYV